MYPWQKYKTYYRKDNNLNTYLLFLFPFEAEAADDFRFLGVLTASRGAFVRSRDPPRSFLEDLDAEGMVPAK